MNLPLTIARRYFFSTQKKQFINFISIISLVVVMVGTMALIIALSVFNGLEDVIKGLHHTFNADLQITPVEGKSFEVNPKFLDSIRNTEGVEILSEIIEDNALLRYREGQMVVTLKGVSDNFIKQSRLESALVQGDFKLREGKYRFAILGRGVQLILSIGVNNQFDDLQFWYPKRTDKVNLSNLNPDKSFNRMNIFPAGVFSLEKSYDEKYVFVPLDFMQELLEYGNKRTSLELKVKNKYSIDKVQKVLKDKLGSKFTIKNSDEQQASLLRAIKIEKFFVYLTLSFILAVASFNIFFSLMMLVIDKKKDIGVLMAMGASTRTIRQIFWLEGILIAFTGAFLGLIFGTAIILLQQHYGFVTMGTQSTLISSYPVKLVSSDFLFTGITIILITLLSSYIPAIRASNIHIREHL
jgi:lipoprotein-releasing system permease protein